MRFFENLFSKKSLTQNNSSLVKRMCEILRPPLGSDYTDKNAVQKYRGWVYVSATHNAKNVADAEIALYSNVKPRAASSKKVSPATLKEIQRYAIKAHNETVEIETHPIIDLLHNPNPNDTFYSLMYKTDLFLELVGDAYWYVERDGNGIPTALYVLYSQYVNIQHDGQNQIIQYDPNDLFHGISPLHASARSYGLMESMDTYEEALNRNMGIPSGILKYTGQKIKPDDRKLIETKWQQKFASVGRAGKIVVTDQDVDYEAIGATSRDMNFLDGRKWSREEILACYGINPALLLTDDVNRSNMTTASINYYHNTLKPRYKLISQTITNRLLKPNGINGQDLFVVMHKDAPQDSELIIEKTRLLSDKNAITVNELRTAMGYDVIDDAQGNTIVGVTNEI
jgi:hypothetical protein